MSEPPATPASSPPVRRSSPRAADAPLDQGRLLGLVGYNCRRAYIPILGLFLERLAPLKLRPVDYSVLVLLAVASVGIYGFVLAGWSSNSPYALLGALRSSAQMISYELSMGLALVAVFLHGLIETDDWWDMRSVRNWGHPGESYSRRLRAEGASAITLADTTAGAAAQETLESLGQSRGLLDSLSAAATDEQVAGDGSALRRRGDVGIAGPGLGIGGACTASTARQTVALAIGQAGCHEVF